MPSVNPLDQSPTELPVRLWRRLASVAYDALIVTALLMTVTVAVIFLRGGDAIPAGSVWFQVLLVSIWWLYFAWSWARGGQTVGMRAWKLVLAPASGTTLGWRRATLRFIAAALSTAAFGLGFLWCLIDRDRLSWHDRLSRTELRRGRQSAKSRDRDNGDRA